MDLLGIGGWEVLLILVIAMIIWGPGRITEVGRTLGKVVRTLKNASIDLTAQVTKELEDKDKEPPPQQDNSSQPLGTSGNEQ